jgi:hypothetical protein
MSVSSLIVAVALAKTLIVTMVASANASFFNHGKIPLKLTLNVTIASSVPLTHTYNP